MFPQTRFANLKAGHTGIVFQSGGSLLFWAQSAGEQGLGISYAISSGNELDLDLADYVNFLVTDGKTRVIALMVEGLRRPAAFMEAAAKALAASIPILIVKIGRSVGAQEAAHWRPGALACDDDVFNAMCERYGIVRCTSLDDLLETTLLFRQGPKPQGERVAFITAWGG